MKDYTFSQFLTNRNYIVSSLLSYAERLTFTRKEPITSSNLFSYSLIKWIKVQNQNQSTTSVGIFLSKTNKKVIIKSMHFNYKTLPYAQLVNEANFIKLLSELNKITKNNSVKFPKFLGLYESKNEIAVASEYVSGKPLSYQPKKTKLNILRDIMHALKQGSLHIPKHIYSNLPKRTPLQILLVFPYYFTKILFKEIKNASHLLRLAYVFYKGYVSQDLFQRNLFLSHKDLHSHNILISDKTTYVIDPEICVLAEAQTDLACIARYYTGELSLEQIANLVKSVFPHRWEREKFISLSIFYAIQMMAIRPKVDSDYIEAWAYLKHNLFKIMSLLNI